MMLYDPKWEVKTETEPSLADFAAWLRTQDPKHNYEDEWCYTDYCPCGQYSKARFGNPWMVWVMYLELSRRISRAARPKPRWFSGRYPTTYGELLTVIEKLRA